MSATSTPASGSRSPGRASRQQRQRHIVDHVLDKGYASAAELVSLTGVSLMTVHRDLDDLAARGVLRKYHGGVSAQPSTVFESSSDFRLHAHPEAKEALGRAAACFVNPGMSVMLDDSTTALALARHLAGVGPLTVVTNYRQAMELLREEEDIRLIGLGGEYSRTHDSFGGLACQEAVNGLNVDLVFQSTSAMN
ncbi:MAG: DeoR/GlpR family DNA-binding transcription regulator, partial [Sciscionella sp.]